MPKRDMTKSGGKQPDEDLVLWERVTNSVKPIKSKRYAGTLSVSSPATGSAGPKSGKSKAIAAGQPSNGRKSLPSGAPVTPVAPVKSVAPIDLRSGEHAGLDKSTRRKLFRGDVPVTRQLDLHGMTAARAENRITGFIQESAHGGHRCVLIITGKGTRGDGVLRRYVPVWLKKPSLAGAVLAIAEARPSDGGAGALYVLLRRNRDKS